MSESVVGPAVLPAPWEGLLHDTSARETDPATVVARLAALGGAVGAVAVSEDQLPDVPEGSPGVRVVARGGAGVVAGIARMAARHDLHLAGLDVALRDEDDLAANAQRVLAAVDAARSAGDLDEEVPVHLVLPPGPASYGWLAAADVAASAELGLGLRTGSAEDPRTVAAWIDAALDRECRFVGVDGPGHAVGRGPVGGFANLLLATACLWEGEGTDAAAAALALTDPGQLADLLTARHDDLVRARRWLVSVACDEPAQAAADLVALGVGGHPG